VKFFVPGAATRSDAERVWQATRHFAEAQFTWAVSSRRIYRLDYLHNGERHIAEVGQYDAPEDEVVQVILESTTYLVCTENRGVRRGTPIQVGRGDVTEVVDFEPDDEGESR
jgi:hypothetical protein